jgi:hypothetical protein
MHVWLYFTPLLAAGLVTLAVTTVLRLRNAGLTETQLFLRYWKLWTALVLLDLAATAVSITLLVTHMPWTRG